MNDTLTPGTRVRVKPERQRPVVLFPGDRLLRHGVGVVRECESGETADGTLVACAWVAWSDVTSLYPLSDLEELP